MSRKDTAEALLEKHGTTFCDELGIAIGQNTPSPLFRWLTVSILFAGRIRHGQAMDAARHAWDDLGLTTPEKMAEAEHQPLADALQKGGYGQYKHQGADRLREAGAHVVERYSGDLRKLREEADGDLGTARGLLEEIKGLGDAGADVFLREAQEPWEEFRPFAGDTPMKAAKRFGLPADAGALAELVAEKDYVRLITALTRAELEGTTPSDL